MRLTFALRVYLLTALATLGIGLVIATAIIGSNRMEDAGRRLHEVGVQGVEQASRLALLFEQQASLVTRAPSWSCASPPQRCSNGPPISCRTRPQRS
jgi:hypothetical protein